MNTGGKTGDDDLARACIKNLFDMLADVIFRFGISGEFAVGAVAQQSQHSLFGKIGKAGVVRHVPIGRGLIQFKISCVNYGTDGRCQRKPKAVGNTVSHSEKFNMNLAEVQDFSWLNAYKFGVVQDAMFRQASPGESQRQGGSVHRRLDILEQIGK